MAFVLWLGSSWLIGMIATAHADEMPWGVNDDRRCDSGSVAGAISGAGTSDAVAALKGKLARRASEGLLAPSLVCRASLATAFFAARSARSSPPRLRDHQNGVIRKPLPNR